MVIGCGAGNVNGPDSQSFSLPAVLIWAGLKQSNTVVATMVEAWANSPFLQVYRVKISLYKIKQLLNWTLKEATS
jgi:hypothetical protein